VAGSLAEGRAANGIDAKPRVRYFDLGDRQWRSAPSWQAVDQRLSTMYLVRGTERPRPELSPNERLTRRRRAHRPGTRTRTPMSTTPAGGRRPSPPARTAPTGFLALRAPRPGGSTSRTALTFTGPVLTAPLRLAGAERAALFWGIHRRIRHGPGSRGWADVAPDGSATLDNERLAALVLPPRRRVALAAGARRT